MTSRELGRVLALASLLGVALPVAPGLAAAVATDAAAPAHAGSVRLAQTTDPTPGGLPGIIREPEPGGLPGARPDTTAPPAARPMPDSDTQTRSAKPKKKPEATKSKAKKGSEPK